MRIRIALVIAVLAALLALPAGADVIHLKNGGSIEGTILAENASEVKVRTIGGVRSIPRASIVRIERKATPAEEFANRRAELAARDVEGRYELALFAREHKLRKEERELYDEILAIDPQHAGANEAVGNVEYDGEWMTPAEAEKRKSSDHEQAMRDKGLVLHEGQWVTPEDKANLEKGLVKHDGRWMTPDEVKRAQGFVKVGDRWVKREEVEKERLKGLYGGWMGIEVNVVTSPHVAAVGPYTVEELKSLCDAAEETYAQFVKIFGDAGATELVGGAEVDSDQTRMVVVYAKRAIEYQKVVDGMQERYPQDMPADRVKLMKRQKGFYVVYPSVAIVGYQMPNPFEQVRASVVHKTSHALLMRLNYTADFYPWWLIEGLGTYQEIAILGKCDTYCVTAGGYASPEDDAKQKWAGANEFKSLVKTQVMGLSDKDLILLSKSGLNELDFRDLAKCWSLVEWLTSKHRKEFLDLVDNLKAKMEFADAVERAFGMPPEKLDKEWHDYVRANY